MMPLLAPFQSEQQPDAETQKQKTLPLGESRSQPRRGTSPALKGRPSRKREGEFALDEPCNALFAGCVSRDFASDSAVVNVGWALPIKWQRNGEPGPPYESTSAGFHDKNTLVSRD
jgi:hypothetical protein